MANAEGRPLAFILTPGNVADISVAAYLLDGIAPPRRVLADKAYDADRLRKSLEAQATSANCKREARPDRRHRESHRHANGCRYTARSQGRT
ncbi:transposase [Roseomonas xinghualingensis]|uniref:transposase n=1 Tax=Roseomonas xinghualingensis TaxID=2986475 RepID=UPI00366C63C6